MTTVEDFTRGITHLVEMEFPNFQRDLRKQIIIPSENSHEVGAATGTKAEE